jgi:molybdate transport system ATP-binding protein
MAPADRQLVTLRIAGAVRLGEFELELDLEVQPGEVVAVLGPNGAGKSTLLRLVSGLLALDRGVVEIGDVPQDDPARGHFVPAQRRAVGVVFQDHRLFPHLRVLDNVAFGPRSQGVLRAAAEATAQHWLERLDLAELAGRYPRQLSGGQAQRVALARALAVDPKVMVLDEPLAALDVQTRAEVQGELRAHLAAYAGPTILVTHDPVEALLLAQRIVVLERGRIVQQGTAADITGRPLTPYVARLVGMNLYQGVSRSGMVELNSGGPLMVLDAPDGAVLVVARPSAFTVHLARPQDSSARNVFSGAIAMLAPLGDRVRLDVRGAQPALVDVTAVAVAELGLAPGVPIWLSVKASDLTAYPAPVAR